MYAYKNCLEELVEAVVSAVVMCLQSKKMLTAAKITTILLLYISGSHGKLHCVWFCTNDKKLAAKDFVVGVGAELINTFHRFLSICVFIGIYTYIACI